VQIIEADIEHCTRCGWNNVRNSIPHIDRRNLQRRWFEPIATGINRHGSHRCQRPQEAVHRIVRPVRISHVALRALHRDPRVQTATPPDLHHLAEPHRAGRFAHQTKIRNLSIGLHPLEHADSSVNCRAFLITCDEQADGAASRAVADMLRNRSDEGGDGAFHVARATTVQDPVAYFGRECVVPPRGGADRHHIRVAGKTEMRPFIAKAGKQVLDRPEAQAVQRETEFRQSRRQHILRTGVRRGNRGTAYQRLCERKGIVEHGHGSGC
jgi:hypothetical protein